MNVPRVANLLRELAEALEEDQSVAPTEHKPVPAPRPVTDLEKAKARKILRKRGIAI